jgi:hypothetical protein
MEIEKSSFFNLIHYEYGEAYFGSHKGMRYRLAREPLKNVFFVKKEEREPASLLATVWPEPYAYAKTDKELMTSKEFEVSEEGFEAAVQWINEQYESRKNEWNS